MSVELALRNLAAWSAQVAVLALAAAAASRWLPIERPLPRLGFAQALLAATLLLPLVQPWRPLTASVVSTTALAAAAHARESAAIAGHARPASPWPALVALALAAGALVQLGRLAIGLFRLRRLVRGGTAFETPWLESLRLDTAPRARFLLCPAAASPATFGLRRPTVVLPALFAQLEREQQRGIALHELLHVRRGDWAVQILEELLRSALFFHPAVHWLVGRVRLAREQAVDAEVVRLLGGREAYLHSLVAVARAAASSRAVPAAPFLRESHLRERVDQLLKEGFMSRNRTVLHALAAASAVVLSVSWTASALPLQAAQPAAAPSAKVNIEEATDTKDLKLVHKVNPAYPVDAKKEKVQGVVAIDVVIGTDGAIRDAHVIASAATFERLKALEPQKGTPAALEGDPRLAEAALAAVKQWRYAPIVHDGKPVDAKATVHVRFALD